MAGAITKVLTFVIVVILVLIIINLVGDYVARQLPEAGDTVSDILQALWNAIQKIIHPYR